MSSAYPEIYLVRHGETEWSASGKHTGRTDIPLTPKGEAAARGVADRLKGLSFKAVWSSPSQRAFNTCTLAGFGASAVKKDDLQEWDYGTYEGVKTNEILAERPGWQLFRDGCPGGESPEQVAARADRVVQRVRSIAGDVLLFSSGHFLRVLAARWIGAQPIVGRGFMLSTASLSSLSYEHADSPAIRLWNDATHAMTLNEKVGIHAH